MSQMKKCKHCQTEIDKKAKVCPNCRKKQGMPVWLIVVIVFVGIGIIGGAFGGGEDAASDAAAVASTLEAAATTAPTEDSQKLDDTQAVSAAPEVEQETPEAQTEEAVNGFVGGAYKIGVDMPSGEYLITAEDSVFPGYLELAKDSEGTLESIITNANYTNRAYITVQDGQYLKFDGIATLASDSKPYEAKDGVYSDGTYLVGKDIPAGEYKVRYIENIMGSGYFEVSKDSNGTLESIITNSIIDSDTYQTIKDGQYLKLTGVEISTK